MSAVMNDPRKSAIAVIGLTSVLGVSLGSHPARASPSSWANTWAPATIAECARLPLSQRGICRSAVSLKGDASAAPASAAPVGSSDAVAAHARPTGRWIASQAVDAQFASTFRSAINACDGPFQIELVDAPPQRQIRFRCVPR